MINKRLERELKNTYLEIEDMEEIKNMMDKLISQRIKINQEFEEIYGTNIDDVDLGGGIWTSVNPISVDSYLADNIIVDKPVNEVYLDYVRWCEENNLDNETKLIFCVKAPKLTGLKSKVIKLNGKCVRVYK